MNIQKLKKYIHNILPTRQKRQLEDILVYKKHIIQLRNNALDGFCSRIKYLKNTTNQMKEYIIELHAYYYKMDKNQFMIVAKDVYSKHDYDKTFILSNILNVEKTQIKTKEKKIKLN